MDPASNDRYRPDDFASLLESLRASEARYRELFDNANDLLFTVDLEGRFTSMNRAAEEVTGFSRDELVGSDLSLIVPPNYVDKVRGMMRHKLTTRERTRYEIEILTKQGQRVPIEIGSRLICDNDRPVAIQGIARDISERKRAEEQLKLKVGELEDSNEELKQFAVVASHDMHAPLRRIATFAEWLREKKSEQLDDEGREWIEFIVASASHMQQLIDSLLAHSRVGTSARPLETIDCNAVVQSARSNITQAIQDCSAQLDVERLPTVLANRAELVQLFQNLIGNAIKYRGDASPRVEISAQPCDDGWRFRVKDNGIGIAPKYQHKIFDAFRRLHSEDEYEGVGIGLATCKKIVERRGGRMWVESDVGHGAEFFFTIPGHDLT